MAPLKPGARLPVRGEDFLRSPLVLCGWESLAEAGRVRRADGIRLVSDGSIAAHNPILPTNVTPCRPLGIAGEAGGAADLTDLGLQAAGFNQRGQNRHV